jgi:hypothetical protein
MKKLCSRAIVYSRSQEVNQNYQRLATRYSVSLLNVDSLKDTSLSSYDIICIDSVLAGEELQTLRPHLNKCVVIYPGTSIRSLLEQGFERFVFTSKFEELYYSLLIDADTPSDGGVPVRRVRNVDVDFIKGKFSYNGKIIYLSKVEKEFLLRVAKEGSIHFHGSNWRMRLYRLRKKFGKEFLADGNDNQDTHQV